MDPLSDMLTMLTVERAAQVRFESRGPYAMRFSGVDHIKFGAVLSGQVRLWVDGDARPLSLEAGDCYLLTDGRPYRTANAEDVPEIDGDLFFATARGADGVVRLGGGPPDKIVIGGSFLFDEEGAAWLRGALPPVIHITAASKAAAPLRATLQLLAAEAGGGAPGEAVIVDRLADILLIQALRAHLATAGPEEASWLAGVADPRIGKALRSFHADVAADWTVARLAVAAGMSRSSFAERFRMRVGLAPLDYLTRWRLYRVRRSLIDTDLPFTTIAARNGYRSRTSCSQSFKRMFGYSPYDLRNDPDTAWVKI
ncbi:MAG TPA: AraC family transcriptional regulator [Stellaceae bacterium]|nr:AraC family transcriptional regulator [Stellaceae bacterium]